MENGGPKSSEGAARSGRIILGTIQPKPEEFYFSNDQPAVITAVPELPQSTAELMFPSYEIDEFAIPTWMLEPPETNQFIPIQPTGSTDSPSPAPIAHSGSPSGNPLTKRLLILSSLRAKDLITPEERGKLKELLLIQDDSTEACFETFEVDGDLDEFIDTLRILLVNTNSEIE